MRKAAALLPAIMLASCAHVPTATERTSLFLGRWTQVTNFRDLDGCGEPDTICFNVIGDVRFEGVKRLSGPRLPDTLTASVSYHAEPVRDSTVLMAVRSDRPDHRSAYRLDIVTRDEHQACFRDDDAKSLEISIPKAAVKRGDVYCLPLI